MKPIANYRILEPINCKRFEGTVHIIQGNSHSHLTSFPNFTSIRGYNAVDPIVRSPLQLHQVLMDLGCWLVLSALDVAVMHALMAVLASPDKWFYTIHGAYDENAFKKCEKCMCCCCPGWYNYCTVVTSRWMQRGSRES